MAFGFGEFIEGFEALDPEEQAVVTNAFKSRGMVPPEVATTVTEAEDKFNAQLESIGLPLGTISQDTKGSGMTLHSDTSTVVVPHMTVDELDRKVPPKGHELVQIKIPHGVGNDKFAKCLAAAYFAYLENGTFSNEDIAERTGYSNALVARVVTTKEFKAALRLRGVRVKPTQGLTAEQDIALQVLTNPDGKALPIKLKQAGISYTKYRAWMKQVGFRRAMENLTNGMLHDNNGALVALEGLAVGGNLNAIQYKHLLNGMYDPNRQDKIDAQALVSNIFRIITMYVTDPVALNQIAAEMAEMVEGGNKSLPTIPVMPRTLQIEQERDG